MLDTETKRRIDTARDILVGKVPDPKSQVEQITIALIYKFMDDMDAESEELGGKRKFFTDSFARYGWAKLMAPSLGGHEMLGLYGEGITKMPENPGIPPLFRDIFKNAYLPYRDPETLKAFLKVIDEFSYDHSERLGDAFEYLLSVLGSQGDAGQFRTPRHIIDFMVEILAPQKHETILDPACGTAGFLISAWKYVLAHNTSKPKPSPPAPLPEGEGRRHHHRGGYDFAGLKRRAREMRGKQTDAEALLWELLRDRQLVGAKFRRQHQFGDYICDFYCNDANLVLECDGEIHNSPKRQTLDASRDSYLGSQGLTVLRFQNQDILHDPTVVLEKIASHLESQLPSPFGRGVGGEGEVVAMPGDLLSPDERGRLAKNFIGYDISPDMVRLSLVNLYLHGFVDPHIFEYDTLTSEERWNECADIILANPPFMSPKGGIKPHKRFSIQAKRSEVLFVDYMAEHLTPNGRAAIIVPEGIIFQSQTAYKSLRKMLVENSLVAVVSLPAGVFQPYSGVKTSILILDKSLAKQTLDIAFFRVENDGFGLGAQRRAIEKNDLPQVQAELAAYLQALRAQEPIDTILAHASTAQIVPKEKIAANGDYNLSGERYRESAVHSTHFPWKTIESLVKTITPPAKIHKTAFGIAGRFPIIDQSQEAIAGWTDDEKTLIYPIKPLVIFGDHTCAIKLVETPFAQGADGIKILQTIDALDPRFLFYVLRARPLESSGYQRHYSKLKEHQIPLPPLKVQQAIVAEIEGYQKVINGARAVLDNYRPQIPIHPDWPMVALGQVCIVNPRKSELADLEGSTVVSFVPMSDIGEHEMFFSPKGTKRLDEVTTSYTYFKDNDVLLAKVTPCFENGKAGVANDLVNGIGFGSSELYVLRPTGDLLPQWVFMFVATPTFRAWAKPQMTGTGGLQRVPRVVVEKYKIPLPPLATQQAIVAEIEAEQALVAANRELITRFEKKIQATLARVWGEEDVNSIISTE
ncbi:MAG: N-6 DNA methylase [Kiritimatiellae bacterium]|nr:N-6 DNA methylase [Kiritimatiellia bacterium]